MSKESFAGRDPEELVLRYLSRPNPALKDLIIVQYAGLVEKIARRFNGLEPFEDLVQVGFIGLLNALGKFDPEAGVRFNTYATYLVAGEIKHYLRDRSQTIRHPAWLQELRHKVNREAAQLQQVLGRIPTEPEIARACGVDEKAVREVFQTQEMLKVGSLDQPAPGEEEGGADVDRLDAGAYCAEQLSVEDRLVLESAMAQLRDLEQQVLMLFHFKSMNQTEIAAKLGISCNYVSHILRQSLAKLRKILAAEEEKDQRLRTRPAFLHRDVIDAVTGAYTEDYFRSRLEEELHRAASSEGIVSIVMVEFRGFGAMKKFYGESSMNEFLTDVADFFKANVRRLDVVARYGETGFGIILPLTGHTVSAVQKRLTGKIEEWLMKRFSGQNGLQVLLGQASAPLDGRTSRALLESAFASMEGTRSPKAA